MSGVTDAGKDGSTTFARLLRHGYGTIVYGPTMSFTDARTVPISPPSFILAVELTVVMQ
ncbi:MAG: hypothetical protein K6T29_04390 [Peptococcaceae bacterium]|nr:hypothetical protein [Peptococcaceae bacterium]